MTIAGLKPKQGLYDPTNEKDACGVGLVAHIRGLKSHDIVQQGLAVLRNLDHRGARGADAGTGDGAGILTQIPESFFRTAAAAEGLNLADERGVGVGMFFLPHDPEQAKALRSLAESEIRSRGFETVGWRKVPVRSELLGAGARSTEPRIEQLLLSCPAGDSTEIERRLFLSRRKIEKTVRETSPPGFEHFYICSLSSQTIVYKGLLLPEHVGCYFPDLGDPSFVSAMALVHSRFSTNTFPAWRLAHPYRMICHNGEINTIKGNTNWMRAREGLLQSEVFGEDLKALLPVIDFKQSDSACLDNALEFLVMNGRSLAEAMMILVPEPWEHSEEMAEDRRAFYEYHAALMEPWDGPAAVCFTDGRRIGATLDRNGLRPCRYLVTEDDRLILGSEAGLLPIPPVEIKISGRLEPGRLLLVDLQKGALLDDKTIKDEIIHRNDYTAWLQNNRVTLDDLAAAPSEPNAEKATVQQRQKAFGFSQEEIDRVLIPMATAGEEPTSSMGKDTPLAILSDRPKLLFHYFRQLFAQVTNPPIDPIRERLVMSLSAELGPRKGLLLSAPPSGRRIFIEQPILGSEDLARLRTQNHPDLKLRTFAALFAVDEGESSLEQSLERLCDAVLEAVNQGIRLVVLSDRDVSEDRAAIPSLLAVSAVHHELIRRGLRASVDLIVETGEARDVHQFACLLGYGASAVQPYFIDEIYTSLIHAGSMPELIDSKTAFKRFQKAIGKGLLKIFSKMGISTLRSYRGAQIFEALGLSEELVTRHFTGTATRIGGLNLRDVQTETLQRHRNAFSKEMDSRLDCGGEIHYRVQGERHGWNPDTIMKLQHATRSNDPKTYEEFAQHVNAEGDRHLTIRGLFKFNFNKPAVPLEEVESAADIVKRFTTGAMSLGALSEEAHETLAVAMNRIGGKSNSGEGGEDADRYKRDSNGDSKSSAIKQIASGRFGVTAHYLVNARELQIKMAQGAKPGEGGQLPGHKVDELIARLRHATPGVTLISPPPHHDIYSIEDLAQLIFDLKNVNPAADVSVKLVSEVGVGTIAAGVAKAKADKILISGDGGGTGASPLSSIQYAGLPWELGLSETHQALVLNGLRDRVRLEADGQLKTGRDVVIAALLGAEEFGFATAPLIVQGCIMMRKCHLNTCPVGIATQDPILRKRFAGQPEHVINYFFFVAEEVRRLMAQLGYRTVIEMVGQVDRLEARSDISHWKAKKVDLQKILTRIESKAGSHPYRAQAQKHNIDKVLDHRLILAADAALDGQGLVRKTFQVRNTDRAVGTMLSGVVARRHGPKGLPPDTMSFEFNGSAGQSFGAFLAAGVTLRLMGEANDYVGKGLSGGRLVVVPSDESSADADGWIRVGNTCLYGATSGELFVRGRAGERFAVRNSGATAVVEGLGDHGCEYMTGGVVVVLGPTGRNFAAGMSGGLAYVFDEAGRFKTSSCNRAMVDLEDVLETEDKASLRHLLVQHLEATGSPLAHRILRHWDESLPKFVKVVPTEYLRVLKAQTRTLQPHRHDEEARHA